jgi:myosin heavy subunit
MNKWDGNNLACTLHESELVDCKIDAYKKAGFAAPPEDTLEYSKLAEKGIDDMVDIDELNPATLLYNLSQMYKRYDIFVYVGPILLVMNPFKALPALATAELKKDYMGITTTQYPL